ncbi:RNA polymerase II degradation factor 1-like isoform X2 [Carica papaya]|uniref:RNA polymerase II degradation factor 1-like isoform X2 n=1 Tax=Carica papaya TaxID=3649 RepID=UPI000B8C8263|nr:RNA polymerase II degradation factor 1-like isoform X2 [Carica papaya]
MAFLLFFNFALTCLDVLAWPLIALGYPLYASIWAIETNSNSDIMKLITYWIVFSSISLSEHALMKLLQWVSIWPYIKLGIICYMLIPQFDGALYIYEHFVHPCLHMGPNVLINLFAKRKDLLKRDDFLAEAKKYVEENGYEALENIISNKRSKQNETQKDIKIVQVTEKKELASVEIKEASAGKILAREPHARQEKSQSPQKDPEAAGVLPARQVQERPVSQSVQMGSSSPSSSHLQVPQKETNTIQSNQAQTSLHSKTKEPKVVAEAAGREIPEPKQVQKEWTCAICQARCTSESNLNDHLQGKRHKAAREQLKANNKAPKGKASATPLTKKSDQPTKAGPEKCSSDKNQTKNSENLSRKEKEKCMARDAGKNKEKNGKLQQEKEMVKKKRESENWCAICNVSLTSSVDLNCHVNGKKHLAQLRKLMSRMAGGKSE